MVTQGLSRQRDQGEPTLGECRGRLGAAKSLADL